MSNIESVPADTSEEKDDEEIVALLPPSSDRKSDGSGSAALRRTPGPNAMRKSNDNVRTLLSHHLPFKYLSSIGSSNNH